MNPLRLIHLHASKTFLPHLFTCRSTRLLRSRTWWIHTLAVTLSLFSLFHFTAQIFQTFLEFQRSLGFNLLSASIFSTGIVLLHLSARSVLLGKLQPKNQNNGFMYHSTILLGTSLGTLGIFSFGSSTLPLQFGTLILASLTTCVSCENLQRLSNPRTFEPAEPSSKRKVCAEADTDALLSRITGFMILGSISAPALLHDLDLAGRPLLFGFYTVITITIFLLALLKNRSVPRTIEASILRKITQMTLFIFLVVFCTEAGVSVLKTVNEVRSRDLATLAEIRTELKSASGKSIDEIQRIFLNSIQSRTRIQCGRIRIQGSEKTSCNPQQRLDLKNARSVDFFHSSLDGSFDVYFDHSRVWVKVALRVLIIFLLLTSAAILAIYFSRSFSRQILAQLGSILNAVNSDPECGKDLNIAYSDLKDFKRTLDDLLQIKRAHESQLSRFRIAEQLEHDIRSPLLVLRMMFPKVKGLCEEERRALLSSIDRITDISRDLGTLRTDSKKIPFPDRHCQAHSNAGLDSMVRVRDALENLIHEKRIEFSDRNPILLEFDAGLITLGLHARSDTFSRVVSNLLNNAIEASPPNSTILVLVRLAEDQSLVLSVMDQGKGIPESDLERIGCYGFTNGKSGGSGIGLYSARKFLAEFGARLEIDSALEVGTTVSMRFPKDCHAVVF
jgi:signal transduction histidine kinase